MLSKFTKAYKYRKVVIILRLIILALFAPYAAKAIQNIQVEESEFLPSDVESIEGNEIMNENFGAATMDSGLQLIIYTDGQLTWDDFLELSRVAQEFIDAGYAVNVTTPIDKALNMLVGYGAFLTGQALYVNGTITAMYAPVELYVGVRSSVYGATGNHTEACLTALNQALPVAEGMSAFVGNRTIMRIQSFHGMWMSTDPNVLASNPGYYANEYVHQLAHNFGPYVSTAAAYTSLDTRRTRDARINDLLNATVPVTAILNVERIDVVYDLYSYDPNTHQIDTDKIAEAAMSKGYVKAMLEASYAPSGMNPLYLLNRLGISLDRSTAYASIVPAKDDEDFLRSVRDRRVSEDRPNNMELTGVNIMRIQISDKAKESTEYLHYMDVLIIMIILGIVLRALPASIGPVLIIGSAIVLAEGILYRLHVRFDVAITQMNLSVMVTAMLGAGVDYAVFMSSRYVEERGHGRSKEEAVQAAVEHAGRSLLTSGGTIAIAFGVLSLSSFKSLQGLGIAVAVGIAMSVLSALVLIPAVFGALGDKFFRPRKMQYKRSRFYNVGRRVIKHKKAVLLAIIIPFGTLGYIALKADTSYDMIALMPDVPSKDGIEKLLDKFGAFMMPVIVLVHTDAQDNATLEALAAEIDSKIVRVSGVIDVRSFAHPLSYSINPSAPFRQVTADELRSMFYSNGRLMHMVIIAYNPYSEDAFEVVKDIRNALSGYDRYVTGVAAMYYDISMLVDEDFDRLTKIVIVSILIFLTIVFGSFLIPLRLEGTVLLNIGGTLGLVYLILKYFIDQPLGRIIPIALFVVLNGLGMDYDIFLVTRILEEKHKGLSDDDAIIEAVANTMRVITACGIIMASSFGMLIFTGFPLTLQLGLGLSLAVLFDTFIMRAFFVPAFMSIAGKRNRRAPKVLKKLAVYEVE